MRAALFFNVLNHGRSIYGRERNLFLRDLCDITYSSQDHNNYKNTKDHFEAKAFPRVNKALPADDINTAQIAAAMFRAGRVMPHPGTVH